MPAEFDFKAEAKTVENMVAQIGRDLFSHSPSTGLDFGELCMEVGRLSKEGRLQNIAKAIGEDASQWLSFENDPA